MGAVGAAGWGSAGLAGDDLAEGGVPDDQVHHGHDPRHLLKGADQAGIIRAITTVHGGGLVFGASLAQRIVGVFASAPTRPTAAVPELTDRERGPRPDRRRPVERSDRQRVVLVAEDGAQQRLDATDRPTMIIKARDAGFGTTR